MKRIKIILLSVTTMVMTLFLFSIFNVSAYSLNNVTYQEGYSPISDEEGYIDEIILDTTRRYNNCNNFYYSAVLAKNSGYSFKITKTRQIIGERTNNVLKTVADFKSITSTFTVIYNGIEYFKVSIDMNGGNVFVDNHTYTKNITSINFNDPNDSNYENCEHVWMSAPETSVSWYGAETNLANYSIYEDFVLTKTYEVHEVKEITDNPINLPSKDVLLKSDIELSSGLKIEGKDNIYYGGNYNLEEGGYIEKGTYYLKIIATYNDIKYNIVYKITVSDMVNEIPRIYVSANKQLSADDIENHIKDNNIIDFTYNATTYYQYFNTPGIYYININYSYNNKQYEAKLPIYVQDTNEQRLKIKDINKLKVGYNEKLSSDEFYNNLDFSYIEVDEYSINYDEYENDYNNIGVYDVTINIKDIYGIKYIQTYSIEVYDNICPNVSLKDNAILEYSYEDNVDIERLLSYLEINDISEYVLTYDASNYLNRDNKVGEFTINVTVTDIKSNASDYSIKIKLVDDVSPILITKPIYTTTSVKLDTNTIKSNLYAKDEIDGVISNKIEINDVNGYKDNYNIPGTYHFEATVKDLNENIQYGSFDIIVTDEVLENINTINIDKNNPLSKEEILSYLIEKGYLDSNNNYELSSDYFNVEKYDNETYSLEVTNLDNNEKDYFEIQINDSNVTYNGLIVEEEEKRTSNNSIIIIISIISVILITSGVLGVIIYKKKH